MNKIDKLFSNATLWRKEARKLREILRASGLTEEMKWGKACYSHDNKNICIIQRMQGFLALLFFKGALLKDSDNVLEVQGPNSRSGYRMRFDSIEDVAKKEKSIEAYIREAIEIENSGQKVDKAMAPDYPEELIHIFSEEPAFKAAFDTLTPGRQRGYVLYFSEAKQSKTRVVRIERCRRKIFDGKGFQDKQDY